MSKNFRNLATSRWGGLAGLTGLALLTAAVPTKESAAAVTLSGMAGHWAANFIGQTGCGLSTEYFTFTLDTSGHGTVSGVAHTAGCGDTTFSNNPFTINTLNANGGGTANLSCGAGCGWDLMIQVSPNRQVFNFVDVASENPGNLIQGSAIRQS